MKFKSAICLCIILGMTCVGCQKDIKLLDEDNSNGNNMNDASGILDELFNGDKKEYYKPLDHVIKILEDYEANENVVLADAKIIGTIVDGSADFNTDNTRCVYTGTDGNLYYIANEEIVKIGSDPFNVIISEDGSGVLYTVNSELFYYDADQKNLKSIADAVVDFEYCISPDGDTVAYVSDAYEMYTYHNGEYTFYSYIGDPSAVSNGGDQIITKENYYSEIYIINETSLNEPHIIPTVNGGEYCRIGWTDGIPQVVISTEYDNAWLCLDGVNLIELDDFFMDLPSLLLPAHTVADKIYDFTDKLYYKGLSFISDGEADIIYIDEQGNDNTVISNCDEPTLTQDGSDLYYFIEDVLYRVAVTELIDGEAEPEVISRGLSAGAGSLYINERNNNIYYVDYADNLYCVVEDEWKLLSENTLSSTMTYDGILYYVSADHILYTCSDEGNFEPVAENVYYIRSSGNDVYYWANERNAGWGVEVYSVYGKNEGEDFKLISDSLKYDYSF